MKLYRYSDPGCDDVELTEAEIIDRYFEYWSGKMHELGREDLITLENCVTDFCVIHWAEEIETPVDNL